MKTYNLYKDFADSKFVKSYEAADREEAFMFFRSYVKNILGKPNMRGFKIEEEEGRK